MFTVLHWSFRLNETKNWKNWKEIYVKSMIMIREFDIPLSVTIELVDRNS